MFLAPDGPEIEIAESAAKFLSRAIPLERLHGTGASSALTSTLRAELAAMGWFGLTLPEADGGSGLSAVEHALFHREVGRHCGPVDILAQGLAAMVTDDRHARAGMLSGAHGVVLAVGDGDALRLLGSCDATIPFLPNHSDALWNSSVVTEKSARDDGPKLVEIATSVASRPVAIKIRPILGVLCRASKVYHRPSR